MNMGDGKSPVANIGQKKREEAMHTLGMVVEQRHDSYIGLNSCGY